MVRAPLHFYSSPDRLKSSQRSYFSSLLSDPMISHNNAGFFRVTPPYHRVRYSMFHVAYFCGYQTRRGWSMVVLDLAVFFWVLSRAPGGSFHASHPATISCWTKTVSLSCSYNDANFHSRTLLPWPLTSCKDKRCRLLFWIWQNHPKWPPWLIVCSNSLATCSNSPPIASISNIHPISPHFWFFPTPYISPLSIISQPLLRPSHTKDDYWIACLVLLSRVPQFDDILLLRLPDRAILARARPQYLQNAYQQFLAKEKQTLRTLDAILQQHNFDGLRQSITLPLLHTDSKPAVPPFQFQRRVLRKWNLSIFHLALSTALPKCTITQKDTFLPDHFVNLWALQHFTYWRRT